MQGKASILFLPKIEREIFKFWKLPMLCSQGNLILLIFMQESKLERPMYLMLVVQIFTSMRKLRFRQKI